MLDLDGIEDEKWVVWAFTDVEVEDLEILLLNVEYVVSLLKVRVIIVQIGFSILKEKYVFENLFFSNFLRL